MTPQPINTSTRIQSWNFDNNCLEKYYKYIINCLNCKQLYGSDKAKDKNQLCPKCMTNQYSTYYASPKGKKHLSERHQKSIQKAQEAQGQAVSPQTREYDYGALFVGLGHYKSRRHGVR